MAPKIAVKSKSKADDGIKESDVVKRGKITKTKSNPVAEKDPSEPYIGKHGWEVEPSLFLIWRTFGSPRASRKVVAFSMDGTLVVNKTDKTSLQIYPDHWQWFNSSVPGVLQDFHSRGYSLFVLSNEDGIGANLDSIAAREATLRASNVLSAVNAPMQAILSTHTNEQRKPNTGMWEFAKKYCMGGEEPDTKRCIFVGDKAGRPGDVDASDRHFAENIGVKFLTPDEVFGSRDSMGEAAIFKDDVNSNQELADVYRDLAGKYEGDRHRVSPYTKVADAIETYPVKIINGKQVATIKDIGKGNIAIIDEFLTTGKVAALEDAQDEVPYAAGEPESMAFKFC